MDKKTICFVTSELAPFAKTGGLADVSAALPAYLHGQGHDIRVFVPLYSSIEKAEYDFRPLDGLQEIPMVMGGQSHSVSVLAATLPGTDLEINFIDCPAFFSRDGIYTNDPDEALRFACLSRAAIESCQRLNWSPQIMHCQDWQTALIPAYLKSIYAWDGLFRDTKTILTIHNLGYQGVFSAAVLEAIGLAGSQNMFAAADLRENRIGFLKTGLEHADMLTTVSPTYAREIQTSEFGVGLNGLLSRRSDSLLGILNGIDTTIWNPATDTHIPFPYSADTIADKQKNKASLLTDLGLPPAEGVPLIGMISRLTSQKGFDLLMDPLTELLTNQDVRLAVLGSGDSKYERFFSSLEQRFPGKLCFYRGFSTPLSHLIEAGSDIFLMPSMYEPCGLNQMYSLAYGTVPIVRKTGGLADTVTHWDGATGVGTGIVFDHTTSDGARWSIATALSLYQDKAAWRTLILNGMREDNSWTASGNRYLALYEWLITGRKAETP
jgi:starch synthase